MKLKTGIDIVNVNRFRKMKYSENNEFYQKLFDSVELKYCLTFKDPYPIFAGKFAAKEAVQKVLIKPINFLEIHTRHGKNGEPKIEENVSQKHNIEISISHEKDFAVAIAILIKD